MPQEIYNEGRVVGLSAWELFVRTALENGVNPEDIPNESQWLTSMIGVGSSMILRIPANTAVGVHDYELPIGSNLSAAGVIIANPFMGECEWDASTWATKVTSYSPLIQNDSTNHPTSSGVPYDSNYTTSYYRNCVSEFAKITDGIVFTKNANWIPTQDGNPYEDIDPDFNNSSTVVRIYVGATIKYDVAILLTGFTNKRILQGLSGFAHEDSGYSVGGSTDTTLNDWQNGGMLGPEFIPWASKIVFTVPNSTYNLMNSIIRAVPSDSSYHSGTYYGYKFRTVDGIVKTNSLIDLDTIDVTDYYTNHSSDFSKDPRLQEKVTDVSLGLNDSYNSLVALYPGMTGSQIKSLTDGNSFFPPALYAVQVTTTGNQTLVPMDTAAPGTIKGFKTSAQATKYLAQMPDNYAVYHNTSTNTFSFAISGVSESNWPGTAKIEYLSGNYPSIKITAGNENAKTISLTDSNHNDYALTGTHATTDRGPAGKIIWDDLLKALKANDSIDLFGTKLRNFATELNTSNTIGITNATTQIGTKSLKLTNNSGNYPVSISTSNNSGANLATLETGTSIKSGTNFIEFSNGLRLYISGTNPGTTNVPVGSIGIGWVNSN